MKIGINKTCITPPMGVDLAGFEAMDRQVKSVADDLYVTSMVLENDGKRAVIICADVIGFGMTSCGTIKGELSALLGLREDEILLSASHTHSGPQTCENMSTVIGRTDEVYMTFLRDSIVRSVAACLDDMEKVELYTGRESCGLGINRRRITAGRAEFAPNEDGTVDRDTMIIKFMTGGRIKAVLYSFACHPSTVGTDRVTADWPGWARLSIEEAFPGAAVLFIQGCCGDIRVRTVEDGYFRTGTMDDVEALGRELGAVVVNACRGDMQKEKPCLETDLEKITLPLREPPDKPQLDDMAQNGTRREQAWAQSLLAGYGTEKPEILYAIQRITLSHSVDIVAMEGEVCVEYGLFAKSLDPERFIIPAGYCNRNPGYIPTRRMLGEGGYEPDESRLYYGLTSFNKNIEGKIQDCLKELLKGGC